MTFLHPWLLLGALAAFIPLFIHLFDRRRPRPHPFGAIAFVLRSQKRTASRLRLKRILLFSLRTLILLAIPLALARPQWKRPPQAVVSVRGPAATAVVLDASLSMRFSEGQSLFDRGRQLARQTLKDLLPEEPATFFLCGKQQAGPEAPLLDRGRLLQQIDEARASYGPSDMTLCLELAAKALEESTLPGKRLVAISDLTVSAFRLDRPPPVIKGPKGEPIRPEVVLRDAAKGHKVLPNHALVDLKVEPAPQIDSRAFQFVLTAKSFAPEAEKLEATLSVGGKTVGGARFDLPPHGSVQKNLLHTFEGSGSFSGEVTLSADGLPDDDRRAFTVTVPGELKALVLNGAPHAVRYRDEAFFVDAALDAPSSPVREVLKDAEAGMKENFQAYDLVLLLNVPSPSIQDAARLAAFVRGGGGLFISMGDRVDAEAYNDRLADILPRPLRVLKTVVARDAVNAQSKAAHLGRVAFDHPLLVPFAGGAKEGLLSARFYQYMLLEADGAGGSGQEVSEVLASYEDGAPALAVSRRAKGRVALFTSTVDRDWSDLAIRTSFLPLMQRICAYLAGALEEREDVKGQVGERIVLHPPSTKEVGQVKAPSGGEVPFHKESEEALSVGPLEEPGLHQVFDTRGEPLPSLNFASALDPSESDLTRLRPEELSAYFGEEAVRAGLSEGEAPTVPVWTWLIVAGVLAFFCEGALVRTERS